MYFRIEYQWFHLLYLNNKNLTPTLPYTFRRTRIVHHWPLQLQALTLYWLFMSPLKIIREFSPEMHNSRSFWMKINLLGSLILKFRNCRYVCSTNGKMWGIGEVMGASNSIYFRESCMYITCKTNTPEMQIYPKTFTQDCGSNILPKVNLKLFLECGWNFFNDGKGIATIRLGHSKTSNKTKW